ncbi:MAG TPA: DUF4292 domain-containing protein [Smithellaceae bacterium]|nr:DUF4292 domain-containing protein [Smithellaceae bacterium]
MQKQSFRFLKILFLLVITYVNMACSSPVIVAHDAVTETEKVLLSISSAIGGDDLVSAVAQIDLVAAGGYYPARAALIIKKPSYLRLEIIPPLGPPDFFLAATTQKMVIIIPSKGELYRGEPTGRNMARFLPWKFGIEEIVAILAGTYPPLAGEVIYERHLEDGSNMRIEMKVRSGAAQTVIVGSEGRLNKLARYDENGRLLYTAEFADYDQEKPLAGKVTVSMADGTASITVKYSNLQIEKARDLSVFDLPEPAGFRTIMMP